MDTASRLLTQYTSENLFFEDFIRSIFEPQIFYAVRTLGEMITNIHPDIHVVSRGGDALNYYYGSPNFVPSHDYDFMFLYINNQTNIDQNNYDTLRNTINVFANQMIQLLNFFKNNVIKDITFNDFRTGNRATNTFTNRIRDLNFRLVQDNLRLWTIQYDYQYLNQNNIWQSTTTSTIDLFLYGNFGNNVITGLDANGVLRPLWADTAMNNKLNVETIIDGFDNIIAAMPGAYYNTQRAEYIRNLLNELIEVRNPNPPNDVTRRFIFFKNNINMIVQDNLSGIKYVAPGDLLTDTARMIFETIVYIPFNDPNNKLDRYIFKYSLLLDKINEMIDLCPENSCQRINATILTRNTNLKDCNGNIMPVGSQDRNTFETISNQFYSTFYDQGWVNQFLQQVPSQKQCQNITILNEFRTRFNPNIPNP